MLYRFDLDSTRYRIAQFALQGGQVPRLVVTPDEQNTALPDQITGRIARPHTAKEVVAGAGKGADHRRAIGHGEQRGRPAGRVIAGLRFALDQDHPRMAGQFRRNRRPRHARADHDIVGLFAALRHEYRP